MVHLSGDRRVLAPGRLESVELGCLDLAASDVLNGLVRAYGGDRIGL